MDYFTKWPEAYAVPDQGAVTTAQTLVREFFCRFGMPEELHSDQGRNFESEVMAEACRILGIRKTRTTPLHPQSDGLVERFNRTLATQLAMITAEDQRDWDTKLPVVLLACRSAVQESTGFTPAMLMLGRELRTPADLVFGLPPDVNPDAVAGPLFVSDLLKTIHTVHAVARTNQAGACAKQKRAYDTRCFGSPFAVGERVWLFNPQRKRGRCPKLQSAWMGPCTVRERIGDVVYKICWGRRRMIVHRDRLAPYRPKLSVPLDSAVPLDNATPSDAVTLPDASAPPFVSARPDATAPLDTDALPDSVAPVDTDALLDASAPPFVSAQPDDAAPSGRPQLARRLPRHLRDFLTDAWA